MNFTVMLEGGECYEEEVEQWHGGMTLDLNATGINGGMKLSKAMKEARE